MVTTSGRNASTSRSNRFAPASEFSPPMAVTMTFTTA